MFLFIWLIHHLVVLMFISDANLINFASKLFFANHDKYKGSIGIQCPPTPRRPKFANQMV